MILPTQHNLKLFIIPTSTPILLGVYKGSKLLESFSLENKLSDSLLPKFREIYKKYPKIDSLYFVRGPGSFMALKLIYIFAKTLEITKDFKLFGAHGFYFNQNSPIKAYGNSYFVFDKEITLKNFQAIPKIQDYSLPKILDLSLFSSEIDPLYLLPAV